MSILDVRDAFLEVVDDVYHFRAPSDKPEKYIVWGETGRAASFPADDEPQEIAIAGLAYYYTTTEYDGTFDDICDKLTEAGISWSLGSIGYDDSLRQIVYEIAWEVPIGKGKLYTG